MKNKFSKLGFTLIELLAAIVIIIVVIAIAVPLVLNMIEIVKREAFRATAYSIADSGRLLIANENESQGYQEFYYLDGKEYNADGRKLDYTGTGPKTGTVILDEKNKVVLAIHNGTYCAIKSANNNKVTVTKTSSDDCTAYSIISTCDTWEQIALKYDVSLSELLAANDETDSNSSTCDRDILIPISSNSSSSTSAGGSKIYYKTYYTVGYVSSSVTLPLSYEYTIKLGVLPLDISDIKVTRVTTQSVFESLDDFERYIVKKNMGEVIWPGEIPTEIDLSQASVFRDHAADSTNMTADDVTVSCDDTACYATVSATVDNLTNVNPNTIGENLVAYTPIKFTVEFNGEPDTCTVMTSADTTPGTLAGTGVVADPYLVESIEDLVALSNSVNAGNTYSGKYISLKNSFDFNNQKSYKDYTTTAFDDVNGNGTVEGLLTELTTGAGFKPIGNSTNKFSGILLGNNQCLFDFYINRPTTAYVGFVGYNIGSITALSFNDVNITGGDYTGAAAGYNNNSSITQMGVQGTVTGNNYVGMVSGYFYTYDYPQMTSLIVEGNVTGADYVGGLVGYAYDAHYSSNQGYLRGINKGGSISSTGTSVGRIAGYTGQYNGTYVSISSLAMSSVLVNGATVSSTYPTTINGANINDMAEINNINLAETALDTYIGGDNDSNGYYWDYNESGKVVLKDTTKYPLTFSLTGTGTTSDPYLITNYTDLRQASLKPASAFKLTSDIDLSGKNFYMLGSYANPFRGSINGNEKVISNLIINAPHASYIGFVGINRGTITVISLDNININASNYVGGLAGYNDNKNIIESTIEGNITGNNYVGMAAGYFYSYDYPQFTGIVAEGDLTGSNYVGGLVGYLYDAHYSSNQGYLRGVYKGGSITSVGTNVGRIAGYTGQYNGTYISISALAVSSTTVNGSTITSTVPTNINGADVATVAELNNINLAETVFDTYIGGDNDSNGYYWDYDSNGNVVRKTVSDYPLTFSLGGAGTADNPYLIGSYADLRQASLKPSSAFKLTSDIDLSGKNFYMLGSYANPFTGKIDGNEKTLSNLTIDSPSASYIGLVGLNRGTISGIYLSNLNIDACNYVGGLAGYNDNSNVVESTVSGNVTGNNYVGMISGYFYTYNYPLMTSLMAEGDLAGNNYVGGLVGYLYDAHYSSNQGYLRGVYKGGNITSVGTNVGRIAGYTGQYNGTYVSISALAVSSTTINGSTITSTYPTGINGADVATVAELNNVNLAETVFDTYIGGDNDGNGYYWDYDISNNLVRRRVSDYPLTFSLSGAGTAADPYLIGSYADLRQASLKPSSTFKLTANIDLSGKNYYMLGSYANPFTGKIDGNEKIISNLTINSPSASYIGLVGLNRGTITGLALDNINIHACNYIGALAGYNDNSTIVENDVEGNITGNNYVGMVSGYFYTYNYPQMTSLIVEGDVTGANYVGGLVGYLYDAHYSSNRGYLRGIYKGGNIISTGTSVGRIAGGTGQYNGTYVSISALAMSSVSMNGSIISNTVSTNINGATITSMNEINNINLAETALDTYIGGDNDSNGYYWDYDATGNVVRKRTSDTPLTFSLAGTGTASDPYLIGSYADLRQASLKPSSTFKLTADIDLTGQRYYMVGSYVNNFTGTFDGNAKIISNLTIDAPHASYIGFVGVNSGTLNGLILNNININASNYVGGLTGNLNNSNAKDSIVQGNITGNDYVGLATGYFYTYDNPILTSITVEGDVAGNNYIGGVVGYTYDGHYSSNKGTVKAVYKGGSVSSIGTSVGRISGGNGQYNGTYVAFNTAAVSSITVNGSTIICTLNEEPVACTDPTSKSGLDITLSNLSDTVTYTDRGFNFTDEALDYFWYIDSGTAKFRAGSL